MKSYSNLWEKFVSKENFELALKNACKKKNKQRQVKEFKMNKDSNLESIRQLVISGNFHTGKYKAQKIYEPKERIIYKLPFAPDRIVQHAVMNILKPILMRKMIKNIYACIEGRGQHKASIKCSEYVRRNKYCLKGDCRKFYPSIDQKILSEMLRKIIKDKRFMALVDNIIFSFPGGKNCPIGNYCSQWFGNFYLTKLDNYVKHTLKVRDYERFCDDFLLYGNNKAKLRKNASLIREFLREELLLECSQLELFSIRQGVDFCGYRHFGKYVLLRKSTAKRMKKRYKSFLTNKSLSEEYIRSSKASMKGWLKWCCSYNFTKSLEETV